MKKQKHWIITDIDNVYIKYGTNEQEKIDFINRNDLEDLYNNGEFQKGTIGPKIKAAIHFLKHKHLFCLLLQLANHFLYHQGTWETLEFICL